MLDIHSYIIILVHNCVFMDKEGMIMDNKYNRLTADQIDKKEWILFDIMRSILFGSAIFMMELFANLLWNGKYVPGWATKALGLPSFLWGWEILVPVLFIGAGIFATVLYIVANIKKYTLWELFL